MADPVFTLTKTGSRNLGGGAQIAYGTIASDDGTYAAGGFVLTPTFESLDQISNRAPDVVIIQANLTANGYRYDYDQTTLKMVIRIATTAGSNAIEAEHSAATVVAAARTGIKWLAFWFPKVP